MKKFLCKSCKSWRKSN